MKYSEGRPTFAITIATTIGFLATGITIVLLPLILTDPESRSVFFWRRIAWTEFLAALVWAYIGGFFSLIVPKNRSLSRLGGVLPALGIVIFFYTFSSFLFMMIAAYLPQVSVINMASQVYRAAGLVVIIVFLFFSWITGTAGSEPIPKGILAPNELIISIQNEENKLLMRQGVFIPLEVKDGFGDLRVALKSLREKIQYSIPHAGRIGTNADYIAFSKSVAQLCEDCSNANKAESFDAGKMNSIIQSLAVLQGQVNCIAQNLRR
jgi:hypothetical protein